jgi:hypothetical protein
MPTPIRSRQGAEMIEAAVGPVRKCSRQNLDKLCREGALLGSPCILRARPLLLDADILLDEYLARVAPFQSEAKQPTAKRDQQPAKPRPSRPPAQALADDSPEPEEIPSYNDSRARSEFEKANILEMDRKTKANMLLPREEVGQAWDAAVNITRTVMLGVPSKAKQRIPHLTPDEVAVLMDLIREALSGLAAGDVMELYPEVEP